MAPRASRAATGFQRQVVPNGTVTAGATSATLPAVADLQSIADEAGLEVVLQTTAAATLVGDTLTILVDTSFDGGTTWHNIVNLQVLGNGGAVQQKVGTIFPGGNTAATVTDTSADLAANQVRPLVLGGMLRFRRVTVGTGSFTHGVFAAVRRS